MSAAVCAAALVLLLDASASILPDEWRVQVEATAAGLEDAAVARILERGPGVAVKAIAFSDGTTTMVGWRHLRAAEDARRFADALRAAPRGPSAGTDIGGALHAALDSLDAAPCAAEQEVVDLSTDGEAPAEPVHAARDRAAERGTRINALGVGAPEAAEWLRENAVTPGGFALHAGRWEDYPAAIRRKLTLELAGGADFDSPPPAPPAPGGTAPGSAGSRG